MKPKCYFLIGVPGSGKSTWTKEHCENKVIISSDDIIEMHAKNKNITYNEAYSDCYKKANQIMLYNLGKAIKEKKDIIWDQTNIVKSARLKKIKLLEGYDIEAYLFVQPKDVLISRLEMRNKQKNKIISIKLLENMLASFEMPTIEEGFSEIIYIK